MSNLQFHLTGYRFRPTWLATLLTVLAIPLFIKLGLWQYQKAETKLHLQSQLDHYADMAPVALPEVLDDPETWRYRKVRLTGVFDAAHQILIDNQVHQDRVGYHVLTPLVTDSNRMVLVNRGWIAGAADHAAVPMVDVPAGRHTVTGAVWIPSRKFYSLEKPAPAQEGDGSTWPLVWQNLDMERYAKAVDHRLMPIVIRMDPDVPGGFARDWPKPAERITTHIGYAYQWFGFAVAAFCIYLYLGFKRKSS